MPRLLSQTSVPPYVDNPIRALPTEPEAITRDEQDRLTAAVRRTQQQQRRNDWHQARTDLRRAADLLLAQGLTHTSDVRVLERFVARLDRRLGSP